MFNEYEQKQCGFLHELCRPHCCGAGREGTRDPQYSAAAHQFSRLVLVCDWKCKTPNYLPHWHLSLQIIFSLLINWCNDWHVHFGFCFFLSKLMIKRLTWGRCYCLIVTAEQEKMQKSFPSRNLQIKVIFLLRKTCGNLLGLW